MNYWLVKSEPFKYSWDDFLRDGITCWDGVRNYEARNNLKAMKKGDRALFYHSNKGLEVTGVALVVREFYQDPTTTDNRWVVVDMKPVRTFKNPVPLSEIRKHPALKKIPLIRQSRLSVMPVTKAEFDKIISMSK